MTWIDDVHPLREGLLPRLDQGGQGALLRLNQVRDSKNMWMKDSKKYININICAILFYIIRYTIEKLLIVF